MVGLGRGCNPAPGSQTLCLGAKCCLGMWTYGDQIWGISLWDDIKIWNHTVSSGKETVTIEIQVGIMPGSKMTNKTAETSCWASSTVADPSWTSLLAHLSRPAASIVAPPQHGIPELRLVVDQGMHNPSRLLHRFSQEAVYPGCFQRSPQDES